MQTDLSDPNNLKIKFLWIYRRPIIYFLCTDCYKIGLRDMLKMSKVYTGQTLTPED